MPQLSDRHRIRGATSCRCLSRRSSHAIVGRTPPMFVGFSQRWSFSAIVSRSGQYRSFVHALSCRFLPLFVVCQSCWKGAASRGDCSPILLERRRVARGRSVQKGKKEENMVRFSIPHRRRRVFSFFDFRSSFPVFPTSLKLRAKNTMYICRICCHFCEN